MGPSFCRNYAIRISDSKYISFIDADDTWDKFKLEKQIYFMEKNNINFSYTDYIPFFETNKKKIYKKRTTLKDPFNFKSFALVNISIAKNGAILDLFEFNITKILLILNN